jgi:hypothetical protein
MNGWLELGNGMAPGFAVGFLLYAIPASPVVPSGANRTLHLVPVTVAGQSSCFRPLGNVR